MSLKITKRRVYLVTFLLLFCFHKRAAANPLINRYFKQHAERVVGKYIGGQDFQVVITTTDLQDENNNNNSEDPSDLPYLPGAEATALPHPEDSTSLRKFVASVSIQVYLPNRINANREQDISKLLTATFALDTSKGDQISFEKMQFGNLQQTENPELRRQAEVLNQTQDQLRESQQKLETLETEREDLKRELTVVKRDLESAERKSNAGEEGKEVSVQEKLLDAAGLGFVAIALLIGTVLLGFLLMRGVANFSTSFQTAISNLAASVEKISGGGEESEIIEQRAEEVKSAATSEGGGHSVRIGETYERVFALQEEIEKLLEEPGNYTEIAVLDYISRGLDQPQSYERSISAMEILGKDRANTLFKKLGSTQQERVITFLNNRQYSKSKAEILLEVGEELRTVLMNGDILRGRSELNSEVKSALLKLSTESFTSVIDSLEAPGLARFFAYLPADQVAELLTEMKSDSSALEKISEGLTLMPQNSRTADLDSTVLSAVQKAVEEDEQDLERPYLAFYSRIVEKTAEGVNDQVISALSKGSEKIGAYLASTVVTFNTFFQLREDVRESIVDGMSIADLAIAITLLEPEKVQMIEKLIEERRLEIIKDDASQIESWSEREKRKNVQSMQRKMVAAIRKTQGDDPLDELLENPERKAS
ncbi:MAG: hypothetical protein OXT67_06145 [Zetaproteobacteria bacterium]|nr:hypothetical protein [Zetaproteobacteria bacterium]